MSVREESVKRWTSSCRPGARGPVRAQLTVTVTSVLCSLSRFREPSPELVVWPLYECCPGKVT